MIYQPHLGEIRALMDRATQKWPELGSRIERAEQLLLNGAITWKECCWCVDSQNEPNTFYRVIYTCECADFAEGAPVVKGRAFCKHLIVVSAYSRILANHIGRLPWRISAAGIVWSDQCNRYEFVTDQAAYQFALWLGEVAHG